MSTELRCKDCKAITTDVEADDRNFNTGRCAHCGGELKPVWVDCPRPKRGKDSA